MFKNIIKFFRPAEPQDILDHKLLHAIIFDNNSNTVIIKDLIQAGANPNVRINDKNNPCDANTIFFNKIGHWLSVYNLTPLHLAVCTANLSYVETLIANGASTNNIRLDDRLQSMINSLLSMGWSFPAIIAAEYAPTILAMVIDYYLGGGQVEIRHRPIHHLEPDSQDNDDRIIVGTIPINYITIGLTVAGSVLYYTLGGYINNKQDFIANHKSTPLQLSLRIPEKHHGSVITQMLLENGAKPNLSRALADEDSYYYISWIENPASRQLVKIAQNMKDLASLQVKDPELAECLFTEYYFNSLSLQHKAFALSLYTKHQKTLDVISAYCEVIEPNLFLYCFPEKNLSILPKSVVMHLWAHYSKLETQNSNKSEQQRLQNTKHFFEQLPKYTQDGTLILETMHKKNYFGSGLEQISLIEYLMLKSPMIYEQISLLSTVVPDSPIKDLIIRCLNKHEENKFNPDLRAFVANNIDTNWLTIENYYSLKSATGIADHSVTFSGSVTSLDMAAID